MVPLVDLSRRGAEFADAFATVASAVGASGRFLLADQTEAFETEFAQWLSPSATVAPLVTAVASGASALQLCLAALGVGQGDEVIVPAFTAVPTAAAVCAVGATPVLVDVEPGTANLDPDLVESAITTRTRAVIVVHLYGRPATIPRTSLPVIEDAAQAHGAVLDHGRSAAVAYSFYPTKNLGGIGDGGAVVTMDPQFDATVRRLRVHGMTEQYVHEDISQNFRMSEVEAAWLRLVLPQLSAGNERRRAIAAHYRTEAPDQRWQAADPSHVHHLCVVRTADRDRFRRTLSDAGVSTGVHYPLAITQQPAYRRFTTRPCPEAEAWAGECVSVPCFPELTDAEVAQVAQVLAS